MKAHWGVRALHACVFSPLLGLLKPPRTSDCITVVVSGRTWVYLVRCAKPGFGGNWAPWASFSTGDANL